ncbi:hypothetical protein ACOSQ3_027901 [Xanthoceras sorbifolium]
MCSESAGTLYTLLAPVAIQNGAGKGLKSADPLSSSRSDSRALNRGKAIIAAVTPEFQGSQNEVNGRDHGCMALEHVGSKEMLGVSSEGPSVDKLVSSMPLGPPAISRPAPSDLVDTGQPISLRSAFIFTSAIRQGAGKSEEDDFYTQSKKTKGDLGVDDISP